MEDAQFCVCKIDQPFCGAGARVRKLLKLQEVHVNAVLKIVRDVVLVQFVDFVRDWMQHQITFIERH